MDPIRVCDDEDISFEFRREVASLTWKIFQDKFTHTALLDLPSMASKIYTSLDNIGRAVDVSIPKKKFMEVLEMIKDLKNNLGGVREAKQMDRSWATLKDELKEVDDQHKVLIYKKDELESFLVEVEKDIQKSNDQICEVEKLEKMERVFATLKDELKEVDDQNRLLISKKDKLQSLLVKLEKDIQKNDYDQISQIQQQQLEQKLKELKTFTWDP
ncbi:hypothetical protein M5689_001593 [Euphorbia peplus]|nr:hypothetical protein M5689_001593 [Euphorbia peplus]